MNINTRLRSVQKALMARQRALFWLKISQERGGYLEYWKNAEFQAWPSETEEGGLGGGLVLGVGLSLWIRLRRKFSRKVAEPGNGAKSAIHYGVVKHETAEPARKAELNNP